MISATAKQHSRGNTAGTGIHSKLSLHWLHCYAADNIIPILVFRKWFGSDML